MGGVGGPPKRPIRPTRLRLGKPGKLNPMTRGLNPTIRTLILASAATLHAQTHKVNATQNVTRAIGVYEWTGDIAKPTAARLVPVTLYIDSHFEDAGVYLARPVPFALQTGIVYYVQKAGERIGTLNLDSARDIITRRSANDDNPIGAWYGYGAFIPPAAEPPPAKLNASKNLPVVVGSSDPDKPSMSTRDAAPTPISHTPPAPKVEVDAADDDRPHMSRRADTDSTTTATSTPTPTANDDDPDRPTLRHRDPEAEAKKQKKQKDNGSAVIPVTTSLNDDPDRPTMHRGKPVGELAAPQLTGIPADLHQAVAVSDAAERDPHPFAREWESDAEHAGALEALQELARPRVAAYIATNHLKLTDPDPTDTAPAPPTHPGSRRPAAKPIPPPPAPLPLANEKISAYQLTYGGLPTFVYTAETPLFSGGPVYLTMIAQRLPSGEMQVALASVTDANHLDRSPWLRPVDAVDPDAGHRASLLFELRAQSTRQFALYRLVSAKAEQTFVTGVIE